MTADRIDQLECELADLERELDEAENNLLRAIGLYDSCKDDAARYRWLRAREWPFTFQGNNPDDADAAVDAAMKETKSLLL